MQKKVVHTEFDVLIASRFDLIKANLGLKNDGEVIRFLVSNYFNQNLKVPHTLQKEKAMKEYEEEIAPMLSEFMEKYGNQWKRLGEDE